MLHIKKSKLLVIVGANSDSRDRFAGSLAALATSRAADESTVLRAGGSVLKCAHRAGCHTHGDIGWARLEQGAFGGAEISCIKSQSESQPKCSLLRTGNALNLDRNFVTQATFVYRPTCHSTNTLDHIAVKNVWCFIIIYLLLLLFCDVFIRDQQSRIG